MGVEEGPFFLKQRKVDLPLSMLGAWTKLSKERSRSFHPFPSIANIEGKKIEFMNGESNQFDAIIFATGYRSTVGRGLRCAEFLCSTFIALICLART
ncbi:hypothetical protein POPTR_005G186150v4 [Populus trichocarpa]|uniref:Flavin-containing monooxygenase n=1 Tax=Populus trichocarpa TaxID=3694 RepID=A0A3N7F501_POPTR|nr:hypothetical protein BDE02_05G155400 [Populus trichocarpa]RQO90735.1 hypothetical protein POPTR_005G186150v4 [Populus trichocarpa]